MQILQETNMLLQEMTETEQNKFDAAVKNRIFDVENCMKTEQAMIMRLRGLDKKREALQKQLGYENKTFREIIEMQPETEKETLQNMFEQMQNNLSKYHEIAKSASDILQLNLHRIDQNLERLRGMQESATYNAKGSVKKGQHSFTSRKV